MNIEPAKPNPTRPTDETCDHAKARVYLTTKETTQRTKRERTIEHCLCPRCGKFFGRYAAPSLFRAMPKGGG